ncbi:uncharacterized protein SAPINGB_P002157 [Magnusiomyces paraingens]|uniref:AMP-dependent synthetase/ligase domain-containing protein n=1 Tax=Magnusiomyces paraingens TaxID=2606893 RepID=A0A5E8BEQ3_9ASCO|nr:uncharacterized protein SAPINGB_P002157 [Saprochaete ingens]VVT49209.1 unnamed protein product [Saprochaete ingens]
MVLPGSNFTPDVQKRIPTFPVEWDDSVDPKGPEFMNTITTITAVAGKKQAVALPGSEKPGYSAVYRNAHNPKKLVSVVHPNLRCTDDLFSATVKANPNSLCLGERQYNQVTKTWGPYTFQTYSEIDERVSHLSSGIINLVEKHAHQDPHKEQYTVGLYGPNSRNWVLTDLAANRTAVTPVALYDTLGPESTKYIVNLTNMPIIFASIAHIPYLLSAKKEMPTLKVIVSLNELEDPEYWEHPGHSKRDVLNAWAESVGVTLYSFTDVEDSGKHIPRKHRKPTADDIFTINFTSGTTGNPKGVILRHSAIAAGVTIIKYNDFFDQADTDAYLSFLPLAHIYERCNIHGMLSSGIKVGFIRGDITKLFEDMVMLKPTLVCGVPRIWNKMCTGIRTSTIEAPGKIGEITREAFEAKIKHLRATGESKHPKYDKVWTDNLRKSLGFENAKVLNSGSAPLAAENIDLMRCALGIKFSEGYGLTETTSGISVSNTHDNHSGSVGPITPTTEVCLRDLPELGYSINDKPNPRGEIMLRGPQVFHGYYKNEEETVKALEPDGWFHTGDVGMIDDIGRIYIIDRVKNMFKLAQGEYVAPERIEAFYSSASSLISQVFIDGNSFEIFLVAVIGVNPEPYCTLLKNKLNLEVSPTDVDALTASFKRKDARVEVLRQITQDIKSAGLKGFELIKNVQLFIEPLSPANGTLTPTLKIKRPDCRRYFNSVTSEMYQEGPLLDLSQNKNKI